MKTLFALVFCISVMLLMFLSGGIGGAKPELIALQNFSVYDKILCTQDCAENKAVGEVQKGERIKVLSQQKLKNSGVLRIETSNAAGWVEYDVNLMQKIEKYTDEAIEEAKD